MRNVIKVVNIILVIASLVILVLLFNERGEINIYDIINRHVFYEISDKKYLIFYLLLIIIGLNIFNLIFISKFGCYMYCNIIYLLVIIIGIVLFNLDLVNYAKYYSIIISFILIIVGTLSIISLIYHRIVIVKGKNKKLLYDERSETK